MKRIIFISAYIGLIAAVACYLSSTMPVIRLLLFMIAAAALIVSGNGFFGRMKRIFALSLSAAGVALIVYGFILIARYFIRDEIHISLLFDAGGIFLYGVPLIMIGGMISDNV